MEPIRWPKRSKLWFLKIVALFVIATFIPLQILPPGFADVISTDNQSQIPETPVPNQIQPDENKNLVPKSSIDFLADNSPLSAPTVGEGDQPPVILSPPQITRTKTTTNKKGQVTGFNEEVRDASGGLLYKLTRASILYDSKTGEVLSYKDTFTFPDKTVLIGTYQNGIYTLKGTWRSSPNGSQTIERRFTFNPDQKLLIDPDRKETTLIDDTLWTGFGESTVTGDFEVIRYKETKDSSGRTTGYEEHVFKDGAYLYKLVRSGIQYNAAGATTAATDKITFPGNKLLTLTYSTTYGINLNGTLPDGARMINRKVAAVKPGDQVWYDAAAKLFHVRRLDGSKIGFDTTGKVYLTPPKIVINPETPILINTREVTITYTLDGQIKTKTFTDLAEGPQALMISETDPFGRTTEETITVTVDTIPPRILLMDEIPSLTNEGTLLVRYRVEDPCTSNCAQAAAGDVEEKEFVLQEGMNHLSFSVTDRAGNITVHEFEIVLDTTPPEIVVTSEIPALTNNPTLNVTYTADGIEKTTSFTLVEGENHLSITETDRAGNETVFTITPVVVLDTIAPEVIVTSEIPALTNNPTLNVTYTSDGTQKQKTFNLAEGNNILMITESDQAGNRATVNHTVTYTPPQEPAPPNASYYVSKTGSDAAEGSEVNPWQSIQYAVSQLRAGDTLYILEGVYEEIAGLASSGLPDAYITIEGIGNVVIDGTNLPVNEHGFDTRGHDYILFKNLTLNHLNAGIEVGPGSRFIEIDGLKSDGSNYAVRIEDSTDVIVRNAYATNSKNAFRVAGVSRNLLFEDIETYGSQDVFEGMNPDYLNGDGFILESAVSDVTLRRIISGNHWDAGFDVKASHVLIENAVVFGNKNNFKIWGTDVTILNSLSRNAKRQPRTDGSTVEGNGITVEGGGNTRVINTTFVDNEDHDLRVYEGGALTLENSIAARRIIDSTAMLFASAGTFASSHVLWYAAGNDSSILTLSETDLRGNPRFVDWEAGDYQLAPASPAIDAGVSAEPAGSDLDSNERVVGEEIDLGAFENQNPPVKPPPFQEAEGLLVIEAEHPHANLTVSGRTWELQSENQGFSGEGYFVVPDARKSYDTNYTVKSPELQYQIEIENIGTYYLWVRGFGPDGKSDSLHVGLDGKAVETSDRITLWPQAEWIWREKTQDEDPEGNELPATLEITTPGTHTLNVWMREDGTIFDKIILTQDPDFRPADFGPRESWYVDPRAPMGRVRIKKEKAGFVEDSLTLTLEAEDGRFGSGAAEVRFSWDEGATWTDWEDFENQKTLVVPGRNGIRQVQTQIRDRAGNTSPTFKNEFVLYSIPKGGSLTSLNTQEGFIFSYLGGDLFSVEKPGEYTLIAPTLDTEQNLTGGLVLFEEGGVLNYGEGRIIWHETPQGERYSYDSEGRVIEIKGAGGGKVTFSYTLDADGRIESITSRGEGVISIYDAGGRLLEVRKESGEKLFYEEGVLKTIQPASGGLISYSKETLQDGTIRSSLASEAPETHPQSLDYDAEGGIVKVIRQTGEQILFENGVPVRFIDKDGIESAFDYSANAGGDFTGLILNRLDYRQHFDSEGNLFAIDLPATEGIVTDGEVLAQVERFETIGGRVSKIILTDGTAVELAEGGYDLQSDRIKTGTLHFADGSRARYEEGRLVEIVTTEGISYLVTLEGGNYVATRGAGQEDTDSAVQFILDQNLNVLELTQPKDIVKLREGKTHEILPNCDPARDEGCEEPRYFYYLEDKTVVLQGNFTERPVLENLDPGPGISYSIATYNLTGQPLGIKTYEGDKLTRADFAYGKIRHVYTCDLDETNCAEAFRYLYEFDSPGNETTVVTELATGTVRKYRNNLLKEAATEDNVVTAYTHDTEKRVLTSKMTWQGRVLESFTYAYDEPHQRTLITDKEGVTRIYDVGETLTGIIQGGKEFVIYHFMRGEEELSAQELVKEHKEDGVIYHYQMGKVTKIEYPDGKILSEIIEDEKGSGIVSAKVLYPDGRSERFVAGARVEFYRPDGSIWQYTYGKLSRRTDPAGGRSFVYYYEKDFVKLYEEATETLFRYDLQGNYLQTDSGVAPVPSALDPLTFSLATISYDDFATTLTKTSTEEDSDLFKAKIASHENGVLVLETIYGDRWFYRAGKLIKQIEGGTGRQTEYAYETDPDTLVVRESGSVKYFDGEGNLFRFIDYKGNDYTVAPFLSEGNVTAYDLVSQDAAVSLSPDGTIVSVTGNGDITPSNFLDINFRLSGIPLDLTQVEIRGSAVSLKQGDFVFRFEQGSDPADTLAPQIFVTSAKAVASADYALVYKADGIEKTKAFTLFEGKNLLAVEEEDAAGNKSKVQYEVTYTPPVPFEEENGLLVIEAEHAHASYQNRGHEWELESATGEVASGDVYMVAGPNVGKNRNSDYLANSPGLEYQIEIQNAGTYYVWVRGYARDGGSDSLNLGLDGQAVETADGVTFWPSGKWAWYKNTQDKDASGNILRTAIEIPAAGLHTLNVWMREDGIFFDKIILTTDQNFVPEGFGPGESFRDYAPPQTNPAGFLDLDAIAKDYRAAEMAPAEVMYSVFDTEGKLVLTEKVDGTLTEYREGRITSMWDRSGSLLQGYEYDSEGNPVKITLQRMRTEFPVKIQIAREQVDLQRNEALRQLAETEQTAVENIRTQYAAERARLEAQRSNLEGQRYQRVCQKTMCWTSCQTVENPGVSQAINQINSAIAGLSSQEAQAYADLHSEVADARNTIETEVTFAFETIEAEERRFRDEIIRQEISPIVFHYYRLILGRDPGEAEYQRWLDETDFDAGFDVDLLKETLGGAGTEYTAERLVKEASVAEIKQRVSDFVENYLRMPQSEKIQTAARELGVSEEDLAFFTGGEAEKILEWLNARSLHFGQSAFIALEHLLTQAGITFNREDLATRLILTDILTGMITPFEEGELLISLFAMRHLAGQMGLETEGMRLDLTDLAAFYASHQGRQMIAHINGNHYVIVTGIRDGKVTYLDPGAGPEGNNQVMEVSYEDFLKAWDGIVLTTLETSAVMIQAHEQDPNLLAKPPPQVLTKHELQEVRGAFFFFLIPFFAFVFSAVSAVATAIVGVIGAVASAIGAVLGPLMTAVQGAILGIVSGLEALAGAFLGFATSLLHAIPFVGPALSGVVGAIGNFAIGFVSGFITGFVSTALTGTFSNFIVSAVIGFAFSPGGIEGILTTLGVPPKVAHYIGVGISIIGAIATGNPYLIASTLASTAVNEIGPRIGLSPGLTAALSIAVSALSGTIAEGFYDSTTTVFQALKDAAPDLIGSFANAGIIGIGDLLGLDPRLSSIIGAGVNGLVGRVFGRAPPASIVDGTCPEADPLCNPTDPDGDGNPTNNGPFTLFLYLINLARSFFGGSDSGGGPFSDPGGDPGNPPPNDDQTKKISEVSSEPRQLQDMEVELTQSVERQLEEKYNINGSLAEARQTAGGLVPNQGDISTMSNYGQYVQQHGIAKALDDHAMSFFKRSSIEKMISGSPNGTVQGFVNQEIAEGGLTDVVDSSGRSLKRLTLTNDLIVEYDPNTLDIVNIREGNFGVSYQDLRYNAGLNQPQLVNGEIVRLNPFNNVRVETNIANGRITQVTFSDTQGELARMVSADGKDFITTRDNVFFDYKLIESRPSAEFKVEGGFIKDVRYTITQDLEINGNNIAIDILLEKVNEGNPILKAIAHNLEQLNLRGSQLDTVLRVIADHFENKLKNDGNIWVDQDGQFRLYGLSDVFDFRLDKITQDDIIRQLEIPADRILNAQTDLMDYANQLVSDAKRLEVEQNVNEIRDRLGKPNIPAILETGHLEVTGITPDGSKVLETKVSSGVIFRGDSSHVVPETGGIAQAEIFVDKAGTVRYTDTLMKEGDTFYPRKDLLKPDGTPILDKPRLIDASVFEINTTKMVTGSTVPIPEKIRIEMGGVEGTNKMFVLVRKESGNFYSEATTFIKPANPETPDEEFKQAVKGAGILEALLKSLVNLGKSIWDINDLLRSVLINPI